MLLFKGGPCLVVCLYYGCVVHHYKAIIYTFIKIFKKVLSEIKLARESVKKILLNKKLKATLLKSGNSAKPTLHTVKDYQEKDKLNDKSIQPNLSSTFPFVFILKRF